jgi:hypothetical protein
LTNILKKTDNKEAFELAAKTTKSSSKAPMTLLLPKDSIAI